MGQSAVSCIPFFLLSTVTFQTTIASNAVRVVMAAREDPLSSSDREELMDRKLGYWPPAPPTLAVAQEYPTSRPVAATGFRCLARSPRSFVMAYQQEEEAFRRFSQLFPHHSVLLWTPTIVWPPFLWAKSRSQY